MKDTQKILVGVLAMCLAASARAEIAAAPDDTNTNSAPNLVSILDEQPADGTLALNDYSFGIGPMGSLSTPFLNTCLTPGVQLNAPAKSGVSSTAWVAPVEFSAAVMEKADFAGTSGGEDGGKFHPNQFTPVPEPPTIVSGILVVLPFGACALRILRRRRVF